VARGRRLGAPLSARIEAGRGRDLDAQALARQARAIYGDSHTPETPSPDLECLWVAHGEEVVARCGLGETRDLVGAPGRTGWIGWYEAREGAAGESILREACARLGARGVARVLGPFHGSTWHRYRLALESQAPFFLGEPRNPFTYPQHFLDAGFSVVAEYESAIVGAGAEARGSLPPGLHIRSAEGHAFAEVLDRLYEMSLEWFAANAYYSPIARPEFLALYQPLRRLFDPALVLLAENETQDLLGFLFAYPNVTGAQRPTQLVAKTLAVAQAARGVGLGRSLLAAIARVAAERGDAEVIHALMHVDNRSRGLSTGQGARLLRRYALYEWKP